VTIVAGVPTMFGAFLELSDADAPADTFRSVRLAVSGAAEMPQERFEDFRDRFGETIYEGYGLTEASPIVCANPLDVKEFSGTVGPPLPSTEVSIRSETGAELGIGEVGEIWVRGPQVMKGYWNLPDETVRTLAPGGWLRTGDMGQLTEHGSVKITDRKKDLINVSGFKVFPNEIEDVAAMHPAVLEAAAISVPDPHSGEAVKLVVVRKDASLTESELIEHCRKQLTAYKVPRYVEFRTEPLPKSPIGKVLRRALRDEEAKKHPAKAT
jgi:long-chain acyl-CoA synthetase